MSIDFLLSELNEYTLRASPEALRIATIIRVRYVLLMIGKKFVGIPEEIEVELRKGKYEIEEHILKIEDVGLFQGEYRGMQARMGNYDLSTLIYHVSEKEINFPNLINIPNQKVWLLVYKFPLDEQGSIEIPNEAYQACLKYCIGEMVAKMPTSPYYPDRWNLKNEALNEIRVATGLLNEQSPAKLRYERQRR